VPDNTAPLPDFTRWPSFPFEGDMRIKKLAAPVDVEPPRSGEDAGDCVACNTPDDAYIWVSERWRVRAMDRPTGLPMVLILECRSHLDLGDLPNLLAAELGVMTVRLERAIRSLDGVARVHVNRWGDGSAHLHMWFLARPYGRLQLRGTFLSLWDDILPVIPEQRWRENLAHVAAWLAEFGGRANAEPAHIQWQSPSTFSESPDASALTAEIEEAESEERGNSWRPADLADVEGSDADAKPPTTTAIGDTETQNLAGSASRYAALNAPDVPAAVGGRNWPEAPADTAAEVRRDTLPEAPGGDTARGDIAPAARDDTVPGAHDDSAPEAAGDPVIAQQRKGPIANQESNGARPDDAARDDAAPERVPQD
jgi:hypothetical protein